jgi:hypothetical protein
MSKEAKRTITVLEREFEVDVRHEDGKVFAEVEMPGFGTWSIPDMGGGEEAALEGLRLRLHNYLKESEPQDTDKAE